MNVYLDHFGLQRPPFKITPDTRFFFSGANRGATLEALVYAITQGEGMIKVVGEVGSGKTFLCRMLEQKLPESVEIIYLANPALAPEDVLPAIAADLGLDPADNHQQRLAELQAYLIRRHSEGRRVVLFVEEAQAMPLPTLEQIRLLTNLETADDKLLQIVLFGQPELEENLRQRSIRQLRERITHGFRLDGLTRQQTAGYVDFRLRTAGYRGPPLFTAAALRALHRHSGGLIRRTNLLADKALLAAFAQQRHQITPRHIKTALADSEFGTADLPWRRISVSLAVAGMVLLAGWTWHNVDRWHPIRPTMALAPGAPARTPARARQSPSDALETQRAPPVATGPAPVAAERASGAEPVPARADAEPRPPDQALTARTESAPCVPVDGDGKTRLQHLLRCSDEWLNGVPASTYSIQIMSLRGKRVAALERFLLALDEQTLAGTRAFRTRIGQVDGYAVLFGSYPSAADAQRALPEVAARFAVEGAYLRSAAGLRRELAMAQRQVARNRGDS